MTQFPGRQLHPAHDNDNENDNDNDNANDNDNDNDNDNETVNRKFLAEQSSG